MGENTMLYIDELHYRQHRLIEEIAFCISKGYELKLKAQLQKVNTAIETIEHRLYKSC